MIHSKFQAAVSGGILVQIAMLGAIWFQVSDTNPETHISSFKNDPGNSQSINSNPARMSGLEARITAVVQDVLRRELNNTLAGMPNISARQANTAGYPAQNLNEALTHEQILLNETAAQESQNIITQAISSGVWSRESTQQLSIHLPNLTEAQRIDLLEQFHGAVNRQELELEDMPIL
jgi:hypothetical protein